MARPTLTFLLGLLVATHSNADEPKKKPDVSDLKKQASTALQRGQTLEAIELASRAIAVAPKDVAARLLRADAYSGVRKFDKAVADYDHVLRLEPKLASAYGGRGAARFKSGNVAGSIADFDRQIEFDPKADVSHWQRGLSYYYAGEFKKGQHQFERYQTFHGGDVENIVWRYLCQARVEGTKKARAAMLKIEGRDRRVPMMQIYDLYLDRAKPDDVFAAARAGKPGEDELHMRLFYAHLYVGLYYAAQRNADLERKHIFAAQMRAISHYMWDVAHVHAARLRAAEKKLR